MVDMSLPFINALKQRTKIAFLNDCSTLKKFNAHLIMNHNICIKDQGNHSNGSKCLLGPDYFILPNLFFTQSVNDDKKEIIFLNLVLPSSSILGLYAAF